MNDNNFQIKQDAPEAKTKNFFKNLGFIALAVALAVLTVFVLNLNI